MDEKRDGLQPLQVRVEEAARLLGYSRAKLYEIIAAREIAVVKHGRSTRIAVSELERWQREHTVDREQ